MISSIADVAIGGFNPLSLILDASDTEISHAAISEYAVNSLIPLVVLGPGSSTDSVFYSDYSIVCEHSNIKSLLSHFNTSTLGLIWTFNQANLDLQALVMNNSPGSISQNVISTVTQLEISSLLIKVMKMQGIQSYVFFGDKKLCSHYETALRSSYLETKGYLGLFLDQCIYQVSHNGSMILTHPSRIKASSYASYVLLSVEPYLNLLTTVELTNFEIYRLYQQMSSDCIHSIVNIQNSTRTVVGSVTNGKVKIINPILYYGGIYQRVVYPKPIIKISANTGTLNPPGTPPVYPNQLFHEGTYFAVAKINRDSILLPNFDLVLFDGVNCGVSVFNSSFSKACFQAIKSEMGIAFIPQMYSILNNVMPQLAALKINVPLIGGVGASDVISSKTLYPMFTRTVNGASNFVKSWANLVHVFGWKKLSIFYTADSFGSTNYQTMYSLQGEYGYEFVNDNQYRKLQTIYTYEQTMNFTEALQNVLDIGSNIVFISASDPTAFYILERFYDLGVRRGDLTFIFFIVTMPEALYMGNYTKRAELLHGCFMLYTVSWVGEYGDIIKHDFLNYYNETWMRSFFIDAATTAANTASFLMSQGKSYENATEFMIAQRSTRMQGASGIVSFDSSSNDRNLYLFGLLNMYQDNITGKWIEDEIAYISPVGIIYFTLIKEPVWSSGTMPFDMKTNYSDCPFRQDQIVPSPIGVDIKAGVSLVLLAFVLLLTIYILRHITKYKIAMLSAKCIATFQDYLALGFLIVESFQVISIGPTFSTFNTFLSNLSDYISLNLSKAISFKDQTFWGIFYAMLALGFAWLSILTISHIKMRRFFVGFINRIESIKPKTIPIMSNYFFLPLLVTMLSILACDYAIGSSLTQSYLNYDCNQSCWISNHIQKVVPAAILIIAYVPLAILHRTLWQENNSELNIRATSIYLVIKNLVYVVLVILEKTIKDSYSLAHGVVFCIIIAGMLGYLIVRPPFNFDRANLWARILISCVLWNSVICTISGNIYSQSYAWLLLQLMGWLSLIIIGAVLQSRLPPSFVVTLKGRNIVSLFRFAFGLAEYDKSSYHIVNEKEGSYEELSIEE